MATPTFDTLDSVECSNATKLYEVRKYGTCTLTIRREDEGANNLCLDGFIQANNCNFSISKMTQTQFTCFKEAVQILLDYYQAQNVFLAE